MAIRTARFDYLQHMISGDIYAVEMDEQETVIRSIGPLDRREMAASAADYDLNMSNEDNDWFARFTHEFRLLSGIELDQLRALAAELDAEDLMTDDDGAI